MQPDFSLRMVLAGLFAAPVAATIPKPLLTSTAPAAIASGGSGKIRIGDTFTVSGIYASGTNRLQTFMVTAIRGRTLTVESAAGKNVSLMIA